LALFGSLENLLSGEGGRELAEFLEKDGVLVVNGDNKFCLDLVRRFNGTERIYRKDNKSVDADIWAESIVVQKGMLTFLAKNKNSELIDFQVSALGEHNVQNLLGAILVANELGMTLGEISDACKSIKQAQSGMTLEHGKHGLFIVDSSYSANPDGVIADLNYLSIYSNKKLVVMPCLIELGAKAKEIHQKIGKRIGEVCDFAVITTKENFEDIKRGAIQAGMKEKNIILCEKAEDVFSAITLFAKSGDTVLLEGRIPEKVKNLILE
jgi:UDP-N-acetylmuramoyl-tripeptide--D-alanyl-D-alanine ligase